MDEVDRKIAFELMKDSSQPTRKLAAKLGISISSVHRRKKRMEKEGIIKGYSVRLDMQKLGLPIGMMVLINTKEGKGVDERLLMERLKVLDGVTRTFHITSGSWDVGAEVWCSSMDEATQGLSPAWHMPPPLRRCCLLGHFLVLLRCSTCAALPVTTVSIC